MCVYVDWLTDVVHGCCLQALGKKKEQQMKLQVEIMQINEENLLSKERKKEEEQLADLRAMEYTRKKMV